jgi:methionyl-tRNA formyltransferase
MINFLLVGDDFPAAQTLQGLLKDDRARVVAVYSSKKNDFDARLRAIAHNSDVPLFDSDLLKTTQGVKELARNGFDWIININSTVILPPEVLALARAAAINMHPGRLPDYAGLHTHQWALRNGEKRFAITVHYMEAGIDTGDIILQREFEITPRDIGLTLYHKCMREGIRGISDVLQLILSGQVLPRSPQDLTRYRLFRHHDALDGRIDWTWSATQIEHFVRAGNYAPLNSPTYTACLDIVERNGGEEQPQVLSAEIGEQQDEALQPGTILHRQAGAELVIICGDRLGLRLSQVRWPSDQQDIGHGELLRLLPHGSRQKGRAA